MWKRKEEALEGENQADVHHNLLRIPASLSEQFTCWRPYSYSPRCSSGLGDGADMSMWRSGRSSGRGNFPWLIVISSHGCLPPPPSSQLPSPVKQSRKTSQTNSSFPLFPMSDSMWFQSALCEHMCVFVAVWHHVNVFVFFFLSIWLLLRYRTLCPHSFAISLAPPSSHALSSSVFLEESTSLMLEFRKGPPLLPLPLF